jgi:hypothetical protein
VHARSLLCQPEEEQSVPTPERPNPPRLTRSKKAPEGVPVQRIGYRAERVVGMRPEDVPEGTPRADMPRVVGLKPDPNNPAKPGRKIVVRARRRNDSE